MPVSIGGAASGTALPPCESRLAAPAAPAQSQPVSLFWPMALARTCLPVRYPWDGPCKHGRIWLPAGAFTGTKGPMNRTLAPERVCVSRHFP